MTCKQTMDHFKTQESYTINETPETFLISWRGNNPVLFTKQEIETMDLPSIERKAHAGRNVEHITRVTGYFSKVSGWNKGKVAELIDRHRTPVT